MHILLILTSHINTVVSPHSHPAHTYFAPYLIPNSRFEFPDYSVLDLAASLPFGENIGLGGFKEQPKTTHVHCLAVHEILG